MITTWCSGSKAIFLKGHVYSSLSSPRHPSSFKGGTSDLIHSDKALRDAESVNGDSKVVKNWFLYPRYCSSVTGHWQANLNSNFPQCWILPWEGVEAGASLLHPRNTVQDADSKAWAKQWTKWNQRRQDCGRSAYSEGYSSRDTCIGSHLAHPFVRFKRRKYQLLASQVDQTLEFYLCFVDKKIGAILCLSYIYCCFAALSSNTLGQIV